MKEIEWADQTINPLTGCNKGCSYCYAQKLAKRLAGRHGYPRDLPFKPTFHPDKLDRIRRLKAPPKKIFLNSMGDWFVEGVDPAWIHQTIDAIHEVNGDLPKEERHAFLVLTKRPEKIQEMIHCQDLPDNLWIGVSITRQEDIWRIERLKSTLPTTHKFLSIEPILGPVIPPLEGIEWVILGRETGNQVKCSVDPAWIQDILDLMDMNQYIPLFIKNNLEDIVKQIRPFTPQQFPEELP